MTRQGARLRRGYDGQGGLPDKKNKECKAVVWRCDEPLYGVTRAIR